MGNTYIDFGFVKANADFPAVLRHYEIDMKGKGDQRRALCPFHDDHNPSLSVSDEIPKKFKCFTCGAEGNILEFVALMEDLDNLRDAATKLGSICDIPLADPNARRSKGWKNGNGKKWSAQKAADGGQAPPPKAKASNKAKVVSDEPQATEGEETDDGANQPLSFQLKLDPAHPYLGGRGLSPELIEHFGLGFCARGIMEDRVCIPIHNVDGEVVAYAGRWVDDELPEDTERYKLPPDFRKSLELFNLHRVLALDAEHVVVVEGYFGAMRLHSLRIPAVALMGLSISDEQVALLEAANVRRITVMLDGDDAGRKAAKKVAARCAHSFFTRLVDLPDDEQPDTVSEDLLLSVSEPVTG